MSRATIEAAPSTAAQENSDFQRLLEKDAGATMSYRPLGESQDIKLNVNLVRKYLCVPTKQGKMPSEQDVMTFMMVCRQRALNPWAKDCYLTGYDTQDGPKFSIIVGVQAMFKRAEINQQFDGIESGVVIQDKDGAVFDRPGEVHLHGENLIGGWSRVHRKDRKFPFYQRLTVAAYRKKSPFWDNDPAGMIAKCAEAGALRQAFPSDVGGLYLREELLEMGLVAQGTPSAPPVNSMDDLAVRLASRGGTPQTAPGNGNGHHAEPEPETHDRPQTTDGPDAELVEMAAGFFMAMTDATGVDFELDSILKKHTPNDATANAIRGLAADRKAAISAAEKAPRGKGGQKSLAGT